MKFNNGLSDAELERLAILAEEASEVIKAVNKIIRHGFESKNPDILNSLTNRQHLAQELGDMQVATEMCISAGDIGRHAINSFANAKCARIYKYLHHQG